MTIKELKEFIKDLPDNKEVVFHAGDSRVYNFHPDYEYINIALGKILAEADDEEFDEKTSVIMLYSK